MSNYAEDYQQSTLKERMETIQLLYNDPGCSKEDRVILAKEAQKLYNILRNR